MFFQQELREAMKATNFVHLFIYFLCSEGLDGPPKCYQAQSSMS